MVTHAALEYKIISPAHSSAIYKYFLLEGLRIPQSAGIAKNDPIKLFFQIYPNYKQSNQTI